MEVVCSLMPGDPNTEPAGISHPARDRMAVPVCGRSTPAGVEYRAARCNVIRSVIVEGFALIGAIFTAGSIAAYLIWRFGGRLPMTRAVRAKWDIEEARAKSDPMLKAKVKEEYLVHCLLLTWAYIGLALFFWAISKALVFGWKVLFG